MEESASGLAVDFRKTSGLLRIVDDLATRSLVAVEWSVLDSKEVCPEVAVSELADVDSGSYRSALSE